jgi:hypothetical protein
MNTQELLPRIVIALPFGIGTIVFGISGYKRLERFFWFDYQGNFKKRFLDNLISNAFLVIAIVCFLMAFFALQEEKFDWNFLWGFLCIGIFILIIAIPGTYWKSYSYNKLLGGFMPFARAKLGYPQSQPESLKTLKVNPSKIKVPRRVTFQAAAIGLLAILLLNLGLYLIRWNDSNLIGLLFRIAASAALGVGISMTILSKDLSRRIERIRDGEKLDYGDSDL